MKTSYSPESASDIDRVVYDLLKQSKSFGVFPTPVSQIVGYAELVVDKKSGLHNIPNHYISKSIDVLKKAMAKVYGAIDRRQKIIYLNPELNDGKKAFVQLHEVGHHTLPWQRDIFEYVEDEHSLCAETKELFEAEANYFASASLFQLGRFDNEITTLPLNLTSIRYLAQKYGASLQATFRRYVEKSPKRTALLVLSLPASFGEPLVVRNWFCSVKFAGAFPNLTIPEAVSKDWPFVKNYYSNRRWIDEPEKFSFSLDGKDVDFEYRYCYNGHNVFVLVTPIGERIISRTTIILTE